jgi:hypothetical protein
MGVNESSIDLEEFPLSLGEIHKSPHPLEYLVELVFPSVTANKKT